MDTFAIIQFKDGTMAQDLVYYLVPQIRIGLSQNQNYFLLSGLLDDICDDWK